MEVVKSKILRIDTDNDLTRHEKKALEISVSVHVKDKTLKEFIMSCIKEDEWSEELKNKLIKRIDEVEMDDRSMEVKENKLLLYRYVRNLRSENLTMGRYEKMLGFGLKTDDKKIIELIRQLNENKLWVNPKVVSELLEYVSKNMENNVRAINGVNEFRETCDVIVTKEREIDSPIGIYGWLDANNPAEQINFIKSKNMYRLIHLGTTIYHEELGILVKMLKNQLMGDSTVRWVQPRPYKMLEYQNKAMILYEHESKIYFEVNHTLNMFGLDQYNKKYAVCKKMATIREMRDNVYGGFYVKMYLSAESMHKIFMGPTHNVLSDVKQIIEMEVSKFRHDNKIIVDKDKDKNEFQLKDINFDVTQSVSESLIDVREELNVFINQKIQECKKLRLENYKGVPSLYMCIIDASSTPQNSQILCKIGYSKNVKQRMHMLKREFMCSEIDLIGIVANRDCKYEKRLHESIKSLYPTLQKLYNVLEHYTVEPRIKTEVYIFEKRLYEYFMRRAVKKSYPHHQPQSQPDEMKL